MSIRCANRSTEAAQAAATAGRILEEARKESEVIRKEAEVQAKHVVLDADRRAEQDIRERRREIQQVRKRIQSKEETIEKRLQSIEARDAENARRETALREEREAKSQEREREQAGILRRMHERLEQVAGMSRRSSKHPRGNGLRGAPRSGQADPSDRGEAREEADRRAKKIVAIAIERMAGEFVAERTVSVVQLPNDDMKGRIIGREGRNIRAIEAATGVDLIIDDTPEAVVISCHNPIRRELAALALERLISDGRIHPGAHRGSGAQGRAGARGQHPRGGQRASSRSAARRPSGARRLVGMLKYRYSYAQNVSMHSIEAAYIAGRWPASWAST